jgi:hypothetical protein
VLSSLRGQIRDVFDAAAVQILSPHFVTAPDGGASPARPS